MGKSELRKIFLNKRNSLTKESINSKSNIIIEKLINSKFYKESDNIFTYINIGSEVITEDFINYALNDKKTVAVPVSEKNSQMFFVKIKSLENLQKGIFNTKTPLYNTDDIISSDNKTFMIVPGLAFDRKNNRLGYGAGYYDLYLSKNICKFRIGIFFDIQKTDILPINEFDIPLDFIITERKDDEL